MTYITNFNIEPLSRWNNPSPHPLEHHNSYIVKAYWHLLKVIYAAVNKILVSKETVVLRRWDIETEVDFIK